MADNWDDEDDWEKAVPTLPLVSNVVEAETRGAALLASANKPDMSKFADEDKEDEVEEEKFAVPKPQPKKKEDKKWKEVEEVEAPLDDPAAEAARRQRLVEEADLGAARDLFGASTVKPLESFLPKTAKDFEEYAAEVASRAVLVHKENKNFKVLVKALAKLSCEVLSIADVKELEDVVGRMRSEKEMAEKAKANEAKALKKSLVGGGKKGDTAGLDDYRYEDDEDYDDGDDFM